MKYSKFKRVLSENAKFNILDRHDEIDVSRFVTRPATGQSFSLTRLVTALTTFVLVALLGVYTFLNLIPVASMTIDTDASLTFSLNRYNRITSVTAENAAAETIIENVNFLYSSVDNAIDKLYEYQATSKQLDDASLYLLIGIYGDNGSENDRIYNSINPDSTNIKPIILAFSDNFTFAISETNTTAAAAAGDYNGAEDVPQNDSENPTMIINGEDLDDLAQQYEVSKTKMFLIMKILQERDGYINPNTLAAYVDYDMESLYGIYQALN